MAHLLEYAGSVHIYLGPYRGNPIALYLKRTEAEAAKSLKIFQQNPELASFIFRLSALEDSLKEKSTLIFDQHTPPFDLFRGVSTNQPSK